MSEQVGRTVQVRVVEIRGTGVCPSGLEVGRRWLVTGEAVPEGMCVWAYNAMLPFIATLRFGGTFPWSGEPAAMLCCPDADNPVVFSCEALD